MKKNSDSIVDTRFTAVVQDWLHLACIVESFTLLQQPCSLFLLLACFEWRLKPCLEAKPGRQREHPDYLDWRQ